MQLLPFICNKVQLRSILYECEKLNKIACNYIQYLQLATICLIIELPAKWL